MKFFIVLSVVLVSALAFEIGNGNGNNNQGYDNSNEWGASSRNSMNGRNQQDVNELTAENLGSLFQRQGLATGQAHRQMYQQVRGGQYQNTNGMGNGNANEEDPASLGYWATYPDSAAFNAKINSRLSSSKILNTKPEVRRKIVQLAEEKFNQCKTLTEDRERACLGRVTGQVMQLVSAVENMARNPQ